MIVILHLHGGIAAIVGKAYRHGQKMAHPRALARGNGLEGPIAPRPEKPRVPKARQICLYRVLQAKHAPLIQNHCRHGGDDLCHGVDPADGIIGKGGLGVQVCAAAAVLEYLLAVYCHHSGHADRHALIYQASEHIGKILLHLFSSCCRKGPARGGAFLIFFRTARRRHPQRPCRDEPAP